MKYKLLRFSLLTIAAMLFGTFTWAAINEAEAEEIFSATVVATSNQSFASGTTEITSEQATIVGGKMYAINGQSDKKNLIAKQGSKYYFCMTNNNTYFKVELNKALAVGDVITADALGGVKGSEEKGLWVSTSDGYPSEAPACAATSADASIIEGLLNYTVTAGSEYVGATTLYIYRAAGATEYFNNFKVTRAAAGSEEPGEEPAASSFRDIKLNLMEHSELLTGSPVYITVAEDGTIGTTENAEEAAATITANAHSSYGSANFTASVPVEGCVKITYATHDYGNDITVTNDAGEQVAKLNTQGAKWMNDPSNVAVAYYRTNAATTLHFSKANYNPYFAVEAIAEADLPAEVTNYTVTFAAGEGEGVAPAAVEVEAGSKITAPKNYFLYKEGATLTGWNDGTKTYAIGEEITPEADMTLTAQFTTNEVNLADRTAAVTITYDLGGYNDNPKYNFQSGDGIIVTQATVNGNTIDVASTTNGKSAHNGSGWHQVNAGTKVTVPSAKGATITVKTYNDANALKFGDTAAESGAEATYTATADDATLVIEQTANGYWNKLAITLPEVESSEEPGTEITYPVTAKWDFTSNADPRAVGLFQGSSGTLASDVEGIELSIDATSGKFDSENRTGDAQVNNGTVIKVPVNSTKDVITIVGNYQVNYTIGANEGVTDLNNQYTATAADVLAGFATITATGSTYFYSISVVLNEPEEIDEPDEPIAQDITATWDYANETVMSETVALSGKTEAGEVNSVEGTLKMTVEANGATFRNNGNNIQVRNGAVFKVPVKSTEDEVTIKGYPGYSYYTVGNSDEEIKNTSNNPVTTYKAKNSDVTLGYVAITSTNDNNYFYSIAVVQKAPKEAVTLENEAATATFPFNLGTDGQKATFSEGDADYFLNSKVTLGSNLSVQDKNNKAGFDETRIAPADQESDAGETNAIRFLITPKFGFTFTPSKVSFKATRYGTDNGKLDIAWQNADGTTVSLATEQKPNRDNASPAYSTFEYDITGATAGEGTCGLLVNLYGLQNGKQIGFADIVIEGVLNGTEKDVPILESFKLNGDTYDVEKVFGDQYEATIELTKAATMVSAENPLTDVTAVSGEVGTITYAGDATHCVVTIPMTAADVSLNYVLNVVQKPDFTLTYINTNGEEMGQQTVEKDAAIGTFAVDYTTAEAPEGEKVRGWFYKSSGGQKFTTEDIITADTKLYAVATEIEESSTSKKYTFNLADQYFYPEDHEAFNITSDNAYYHDNVHGWAIYNGDKIDLLVGPKATISVAVCKYGSGTNILVKKGEETLATLDGKNADSDGAVVAYQYEGEAGTLTLEMVASGEMYLHNVKIVNTAETSYDNEGQWYFAKAGDASSFLDILDVVNGTNASTDAERSFIYLPNGTYDLKQTVLTGVTGHNISIIGESQDGVIIKNAPDIDQESINNTATLKNTGTGNYYQDLTIQNALDYYGAQANGLAGGRAVCLWDTGTRTALKNVTMLSYQDTYYSNNDNGLYYFEGCDIHGTVDFFCGSGALFVESSTITVEKRKADGSGECTITAPYTAAGKTYGYVFNNCKIENLAEKYNFGRAWGGEPRCAWLNTTLNDNKLNTNRWTAQGMNVAAKEFVEYNTMDAEGNVVSPSTHVMDFYKGDAHNEMETILTAEQAANFTVDKVLANWAAADATKQFELAAEPTMEDNTITWTAVDGAAGYAIFANDELLAIVDADVTSYIIESSTDAAPRKAEDSITYSVRVINAMGGMGEAAIVALTDGIDVVKSNGQLDGQNVYTLQGVRVNKATKGVYIVNGRKVVIK